jgi:hypothetical protein
LLESHHFLKQSFSIYVARTAATAATPTLFYGTGFQGLSGFKARQHFRQRDAEALGDQDECVKTAILLAAFQGPCKSAVYVCLGSKFLLAPASQRSKLTDAAAERLSQHSQFVPERINFTLRSAHVRKSDGFYI